jgi:prophage maintenance system killer protein
MVYSVHEQLRKQAGFHQMAAQEAKEAEAAFRQGSQDKVAQGDEDVAVEDLWVPDEPWVKERNRQILTEFGQHSQAEMPAVHPNNIEGALGRVQNHYYYGCGDFLAAAAIMAHGIGESQAYDDGNKRTALLTVQDFLDNNGYDHISPEGSDDDELAKHLIGYGVWTQYENYQAGIGDPPPYYPPPKTDDNGNVIESDEEVWPYSPEEAADPSIWGGPYAPISTADLFRQRHQAYLEANGHE